MYIIFKKLTGIMFISLFLASFIIPNNSFAGQGQYDIGTNPSVTYLKDEIAFEIHQEQLVPGDRPYNKLYYKIGKYKDKSDIEWDIGHTYLDDGIEPSATRLDNGDILVVYRDDTNEELYYSLGKYKNGNMDWYVVGERYATGMNPSVTVLKNGDILSIHQGQMLPGDWPYNRLYYQIGKYNNNDIEWSGRTYLDDGIEASLALTDNNHALAVYRKDTNEELYYALGEYKDGNMKWYVVQERYATGMNPSVTVLTGGAILEVHQGSTGDNKLYLSVGTVRDTSIDWTEFFIVDGIEPSITHIDNDNNSWLLVFRDNVNHNLYYDVWYWAK
ncbi:hypothetical protein [Chengkuizengella marina]|uniref:Uncharacterized protein n=1 Tax=Chengkuizengella marina TaxID=2507566 RepID=A0A6N9Q1U3_9BACL|nr:hypothetical protein [Chengkuizengella marina]NBI28144.1 hypothetical protein [Chengkuizengella marina]